VPIALVVSRRVYHDPLNGYADFDRRRGTPLLHLHYADFDIRRRACPSSTNVYADFVIRKGACPSSPLVYADFDIRKGLFAKRRTPHHSFALVYLDFANRRRVRLSSALFHLDFTRRRAVSLIHLDFIRSYTSYSSTSPRALPTAVPLRPTPSSSHALSHPSHLGSSFLDGFTTFPYDPPKPFIHLISIMRPSSNPFISISI
jgi:hypothetical protein